MTMRIFVTGATGFIGSATVRELLSAGHQVLGLVRSDSNATGLAAMGGTVVRGSLEDVDSLRRGAEAADAVIHTAFIHDGFANFAHNCAVYQRAIAVIGEVLAGSSAWDRGGAGRLAVALDRRRRGDDARPFGGDWPEARAGCRVEVGQRGVRALRVVRLDGGHRHAGVEHGDTGAARVEA
jgi:putative NADH-flavin reductase